MKDEIKEILLKDFNEILVKEFCTDWKEKRLYIELLVNSTPFSNLLNYITNLQEEVKSANESITWWNNRFNAVQEENKKLKNKLEDEKKNYKRITTYLQEENQRLKMTNLALADDITKNKIIKQEVLTECCGIPIGEIPMLKIQNDEYKQRIDKAIEYIEKGNKHFKENYNEPYEYAFMVNADEIMKILKGKSDE